MIKLGLIVAREGDPGPLQVDSLPLAADLKVLGEAGNDT
jgi:hypothetical protein